MKKLNNMDYIFPVAIFAVLYFFMIRPQQKRSKDQKNFATDLKKGDDVVSNSGIIGKITKVDDNIVTLQVGNKVYMDFLKGTISKDMTELLPKISAGEVVEANVEK